MKTTFTIFLLILGLATYIIFISTTPPEYFRFTGLVYDVRVINGFTNNSSLALVIWCNSPDGDMGGRALQQGDDFSWSVRASLWEGSLFFFCTMKWDQIRRPFVAFKASRDVRRCVPSRKCSWMVKEDGFYFSNNEITWRKDFSWF